MIYTVISKLPFISSDTSNRKIFKIFLFGSLIYALLHYYVFSKTFGKTVEKYKSYIYYFMMIDFAIAYFLSGLQKQTKSKDQSNDENENNDDNKENNLEKNLEKNKLADFQKAELEKNYEKIRQLQLMQANAYRQQLFNEQHKQDQQSIHSKHSSKHSNSVDDISLPKLAKSPKKKSNQHIEDTDIPVYHNK